MSVVLRDSSFTNLTRQHFDDAYQSKVAALDVILKLVDFNLLLSTISAAFSNADQAPHVAAQLYLTEHHVLPIDHGLRHLQASRPVHQGWCQHQIKPLGSMTAGILNEIVVRCRAAESDSNLTPPRLNMTTPRAGTPPSLTRR